MNKDVIYIDVDDDVTAVIGKIKSAKEKIVAIVPPKRPGALQSAVNLRLLDRMAKADKKQLVLISSNPALVALAANAQIPVAKNLQSKPEIAEIPAIVVDDGDDIIDGNDVPVGEYAAGISGMKISRNDVARDAAIEGVDVEKDSAFAPVTVGAAAAKKGSKKSASKIKIPNFDSFRKRIFIGLAALVLLAGVLVWAFVFAPAATVIITARTSTAPVSSAVTLSTTAASSYGSGVVKVSSQTEKKADTLEFDATGTKDAGEKATGTVRVSNSLYENEGATLPAGTRLSTNAGTVFTTDSAFTFTASNRSGEVDITATESGTASNGANGNLRGAPNGINVTITNPTAGGTSKQIKVATASDIERAQGDIIGRSTEDMKKALTAKFTNGEKVIDSSFVVQRGQAVATPAEGAEAPNGKATLAIETTYTLYAVAKADLVTYLDDSIKEQILDDTNQRVYDNGYDTAAISNFRQEGDVLTAGVTATGQIGPKVEEADIKERVKGKIYGEAQSSIQSIEGVQDVNITFSYFWVRTIPNDVDKIKVEFTLKNE
jgi:hypothetical protein